MFAGNALCGLLFLMMQNITFWSSGMCRKHNRDSFLGFKWHRGFNFSLSFSLLLPILFYQILDLFFSFAEHLLGFILVGKFFGKTLRTRCLKKKVGSGTRFSWEFSCQLYMFFWPFSLASLTESCSFWHHLKDLFPCTSWLTLLS